MQLKVATQVSEMAVVTIEIRYIFFRGIFSSSLDEIKAEKRLTIPRVIAE